MVKHICVIGAGASGLASIKNCLDDDLLVSCFERSEDIGGLWRYTEGVSSKASVAKSTTINTSKEFTAFGDFPVPDDYPNFMRHEYVMQYFRLYAKKFDLLRHIEFNTDVMSIDYADDYNESGKWQISYKSNLETNDDSKSRVFDGVIICTGHHAKPHIPHFEGIEKFQGQVLHTHEYKSTEPFSDKNILLIGIGNSGMDCAVELARYAKRLHVSTRHGAWCFPKTQPNGLPVDLTFSRFGFILLKFMPSWMANRFLIKSVIKTDHDLLGLRPPYGPMAEHGLANDELPNRIVSGLIKISPNVEQFGLNSVKFVDGTEFLDLDVVILATGYIVGFPFLSPSVLKVEANKVDLYKLVFPPHLKHPTLAIIGCVQPHGSTITIAELQSRWAVRVLAGKQNLPTTKQQKAEVARRRQIMERRYVRTQRHTIQVDLIPYMDEIASEIGCQPSLFRILSTFDFRLAWAWIFGPAVPFQYRLFGPNSWSGAREAILTVYDRVLQPLKTSISAVYSSTHKKEV